MVIFNYFTAFCLIVILIRVVILFIPGTGNGEDKISKALGMIISMILISVAWGCIYAFFDYDNKSVSSSKNEPPKSSVVKFEDK